jgi:hypothetical protein
MSHETMNTILTSVIVPVIVALVPFIVAYINKLSEHVKVKINDEKINRYIAIAEDAIETAVVATGQTFVDAVKGTEGWTDETKKKAFEQAKLQAITIMGTGARQALKEVYGDIDAWIDSKIEAYVRQHKAPG